MSSSCLPTVLKDWKERRIGGRVCNAWLDPGHGFLDKCGVLAVFFCARSQVDEEVDMSRGNDDEKRE